MRVVLDSNVLLSALISKHGAPDVVYKAWRAGRFELITSTVQLDELRLASRYPKLKTILPAHRIGAMVNNMHNAIVLERLSTLPQGIVISDPHDEYVFVMALDGQADYLITGDRWAGLLKKGNAGQARIIAPAQFFDEAL